MWVSSYSVRGKASSRLGSVSSIPSLPTSQCDSMAPPGHQRGILAYTGGIPALAGGMSGEGSNIGTVPDGWQVC